MKSKLMVLVFSVVACSASVASYASSCSVDSYSGSCQVGSVTENFDFAGCSIDCGFRQAVCNAGGCMADGGVNGNCYCE